VSSLGVNDDDFVPSFGNLGWGWGIVTKLDPCFPVVLVTVLVVPIPLLPILLVLDKLNHLFLDPFRLPVGRDPDYTFGPALCCRLHFLPDAHLDVFDGGLFR
jgi:hypothetical protein